MDFKLRIQKALWDFDSIRLFVWKTAEKKPRCFYSEVSYQN